MAKDKKYKCLECDKDFIMSPSGLRRRKKRKDEPICKECYSKINKGGRYGDDYYPEEIRCFLKDGYFEYEDIKKYFPTLKTKMKMRFTCEICGKRSVAHINAMKQRKICKQRLICKYCALKFATNSEEWIDNNSKSQKIAQNRTEVLEKQRNAQRLLMKTDPMYIEKRMSKSYVSGKIREMRFDSSWELYFLVYCWENSDIISILRYDGSISYEDKDGVSRKYYPDFIVRYKKGKSRIVEIKGTKKYNNFHEKFNAARKKHGDCYVVYGEKELKKLGIYLTRETYLREFYRRYYHEIEFFDNKRIDNLKKRIKKWLK